MFHATYSRISCDRKQLLPCVVRPDKCFIRQTFSILSNFLIKINLLAKDTWLFSMAHGAVAWIYFIKFYEENEVSETNKHTRIALNYGAFEIGCSHWTNNMHRDWYSTRTFTQQPINNISFRLLKGLLLSFKMKINTWLLLDPLRI